MACKRSGVRSPLAPPISRYFSVYFRMGYVVIRYLLRMLSPFCMQSRVTVLSPEIVARYNQNSSESRDIKLRGLPVLLWERRFSFRQRVAASSNLFDTILLDYASLKVRGYFLINFGKISILCLRTNSHI